MNLTKKIGLLSIAVTINFLLLSCTDEKPCASLTWYQDIDNDGFGNSEVVKIDCAKPEGFTDNADDCDDNNFQINPAAVHNESIWDVNCDGVVDGDVHLWNKNDVESFGSYNFSSITGSLKIGDNADPSLITTSLKSLKSLINIGGNLTITHNPGLESLEGLENLSSIGGQLIITYNFSLKSLQGLENLVNLGGSLYLEDNYELIDISQLQNLEEINGALNFVNNNSIKELRGMENITKVDGFLSIHENDELLSLNALKRIEYINGNLFISRNAKLPSISGLKEVKTIAGELRIEDNRSLLDAEINSVISKEISITGNRSLVKISSKVDRINGNLQISWNPSLELLAFDNLEFIEGNLGIQLCSSLTNLAGFDKLSKIGGALMIRENDLLQNLVGLSSLTSLFMLSIDINESLINLEGLSNLTSIGNNVYINNNDLLESLTGLENLETVSGTLIKINSNPRLKNFCALQGLFSKGNQVAFNVFANAFNPEMEQIKEGFCSI